MKSFVSVRCSCKTSLGEKNEIFGGVCVSLNRPLPVFVLNSVTHHIGPSELAPLAL